ncbi:MAG: metallophosphoesterase family protein [Chloroflexota bacterium]
MTTIVALSDSHATSLSSLSPALRDALKGADVIVHAGDQVESTVFEELKASGNLIAVAGNMDSTALKVALPVRQLFTAEGKTIGVTHGSGAPRGIQQRVRALFPENPDIIIYGHSHVAHAGTVNGSLMVNPGPAASSYAVVTIAGDVTAHIVHL